MSRRRSHSVDACPAFPRDLENREAAAAEVVEISSPQAVEGEFCAELLQKSCESNFYHPFLINAFRDPFLEHAFLDSFYGKDFALYWAMSYFIGAFMYAQFTLDDFNLRWWSNYVLDEVAISRGSVYWTISCALVGIYLLLVAIVSLVPCIVRRKFVFELFFFFCLVLGAVRFSLRDLDLAGLRGPVKAHVFYFDFCYVAVARPRAIVAAFGEFTAAVTFSIAAVVVAIQTGDVIRLVVSISTYWFLASLVVLFLAGVNRSSREVFLWNQRLISTRSKLAAANTDRSTLLKNILPTSFLSVVLRLQAEKSLQKEHLVYTRTYLHGGLLQLDIVGFTAFAATNHPNVVTRVLNMHYSCFDTLTTHSEFSSVEKVKTLGDAYIAFASDEKFHDDDHDDDDDDEFHGVGSGDSLPYEEDIVLDEGTPTRGSRPCIVQLVALGLAFIEAGHIVNRVTNREASRSMAALTVRVGIAKGRFVAGVHGDPSRRIAFDVFGNLMAELEWLEQTSPIDGIQVNQAVVATLMPNSERGEEVVMNEEQEEEFFVGMQVREVMRDEEGDGNGNGGGLKRTMVGIFEFSRRGMLGEEEEDGEDEDDFECFSFIADPTLATLIGQLLQQCERLLIKSFSMVLGRANSSDANISPSSITSPSVDFGGAKETLRFVGDVFQKNRDNDEQDEAFVLAAADEDRMDLSCLCFRRERPTDLNGKLKWVFDVRSPNGLIYPLACYAFSLKKELKCYRETFERSRVSKRLFFPTWFLYNLTMLLHALFSDLEETHNVITTPFFCVVCVSTAFNLLSSLITLLLPNLPYIPFLLVLFMNLAFFKAQQILLLLTGFHRFAVVLMMYYGFMSAILFVSDVAMHLLLKVFLWGFDLAMIWLTLGLRAENLAAEWNYMMRITIVLLWTMIYGAGFREFYAKLAWEMHCTSQQEVARLKKEKDKNEKLIASFLPASVALELIQRKFRGFSSRVHAFVCFVSVTNVDSYALSELIRHLSKLFCRYDALLEAQEFRPIKKHGHVYLFMSPDHEPETSPQLLRTTLEVLEEFIAIFEDRKENHNEFVQKRSEKEVADLKIGLALGEFGAGLLGLKRYLYDVFGDVVNLSARLMQVVSKNHEIVVSLENVEKALSRDVRLKNLGFHVLKGKGEVECVAVSLKDSPIHESFL